MSHGMINISSNSTVPTFKKVRSWTFEDNSIWATIMWRHYRNTGDAAMLVNYKAAHSRDAAIMSIFTSINAPPAAKHAVIRLGIS